MTIPDVDALAEQVPDGALLALPPDYSFVPMALIRALIRRGVKDLHVLAVPISGMAADLLIGAVLIPGARAPTVVSRQVVKSMRPGSAIVDIAIDQGGCIETIRPTSHEKPTYLQHGIVHYAVPNMPALVGRSSTMGLTQATEPYLAMLVEKGIEKALAENSGLVAGVNTRDGQITCDAVARALGY